MKSIVLDTNCLLQVIPKRSPYRHVWEAFLNKQFILCLSNDIIEEYQEILSTHTTPRIAENIILLLFNQRNVRLITPYFRMELITIDEDDNKFVDCAFAANTDYIVTNDTHFNVLKELSFPNIQVITLQQFATLINGVNC